MKSTFQFRAKDGTGSPFTLPVVGPVINAPFYLKELTGLDTPNVIRKFKGFGLETNNKLYDFSMEKRVITMRIGINPAPYFELIGSNPNPLPGASLASVLKSNIYGLVSHSSAETDISLCFVFEDQDPTWCIDGYITKLESDLFSKGTEVILEFTCDDPFFRSYSYIEPIINPGTYRYLTITDENSSVPHGMKFSVEFYGPSQFFEIKDVGNDYTQLKPSNWAFKIVPGVIDGILGFQNLDVLHVSSEENDRYAYLVREGETIHLLDKIAPGSIWPVVNPGMNQYETNLSGSVSTWLNYFQYLEVKYKTAYWGF